MSTSIAVLSHGLAATAFFALSVLLINKWRGRLFATALAIACVLSMLWFTTLSFQLATGRQLGMSADILELLRNAAWTLFLLILLGPFRPAQKNAPVRLKLSLVTIAAFYTLLLFFTLYSYWNPAFLQDGSSVMHGTVAHLAQAIIGLLLLEQLYRNTPAQERWEIKFFCLGAGGMFAYDFYLYSDSLLFRQLDADIWVARGAVNALIVPLLAMSAARNPTWSAAVSVSRNMLFHSTTVLVSAVYLLLMSAAGYYLRLFGGSWGAIMQVVFLFLAAILLASLLFSGAARAWLRVFISKHFYHYNYDYREEWLRFTHTLSRNEQGLGERSIQALAALVESPGGILFISRGENKCEPAASWSMPPPSMAAQSNAGVFKYIENKQWVIDIQECRANPEKYAGLSLPQWLKNDEKAWLLVPLILRDSLFGFMLLAQPRIKIKLNWEILDLLKIAGSQAASYLAQEESANALMLARQFESVNRMSTFVVHDLKNLVSQLSLLLANAEKHKNNPTFQKDMLDTLALSVQKMKLLLRKLGRDAAAESSAPIPVARLLQQAVQTKSACEPRPVLEIKSDNLMILASWDRLERVIGHLIQNAIEATPKEGRVSISLERQDDCARIAIMDTGQGMSELFMREKLYKPFESTKSAGMGIGVFESREYIQELGGQLEVSSAPAAGTTFHVILPLFRQAYPAAVLA